jgi:hypothetical protein
VTRPPCVSMAGHEPLAHQPHLLCVVAHEHGDARGAEAAAAGVKIGAAHDDRSRRRSRVRPGNMRNGLCT